MDDVRKGDQEERVQVHAALPRRHTSPRHVRSRRSWFGTVLPPRRARAPGFAPRGSACARTAPPALWRRQPLVVPYTSASEGVTEAFGPCLGDRRKERFPATDELLVSVEVAVDHLFH